MTYGSFLNDRSNLPWMRPVPAPPPPHDAHVLAYRFHRMVLWAKSLKPTDPPHWHEFARNYL